jgi:ribosomal protein S18 acetylase RimI-like enzyme
MLEFPSMLDYGLEGAAEVLTRAFEDYFVRIPFPVPVLLNLARADSVDLSLSRVFVRDGIAVGAGLIARRGWSCRLAGMGVTKEARRSGVGRAAVIQLLDEAKGRADRTMFLEVIEQNTAAVELYRAAGFQTMRSLVGFSGLVESSLPSGPSDVVEVDLREVAHAVTRLGPDDLPWQLSGETIAQLAAPAVGYRLDEAWIAITDPAQPVVTVRALISDLSCPACATALLRAVMAKYPGKTEWRFSPVWPEELAPMIEPVRLPPTALTQLQMQFAV